MSGDEKRWNGDQRGSNMDLVQGVGWIREDQHVKLVKSFEQQMFATSTIDDKRKKYRYLLSASCFIRLLHRTLFKFMGVFDWAYFSQLGIFALEPFLKSHSKLMSSEPDCSITEFPLLHIET